ncbi:MAG TPA: DUF4153 domain-containing protein, partial [Candidatus Limnocylindria bacterium]
MTSAAAIPATGERAHGARLIPRAGAICLAAVGVGLLAQLLFFDTGIGINLALAVGAILTVAWFVPERSTRWPALRDAWLPIAAIGLALFAALRGDHSLIALDVMGSAVLTSMALASFGAMTILLRPLGGLVDIAGRGTTYALTGVADALLTLRQTVPWRHRTADLGVSAGVLRGLLLALPLVFIFAWLFAGADAVFNRMLADLFSWDVNLGL